MRSDDSLLPACSQDPRAWSRRPRPRPPTGDPFQLRDPLRGKRADRFLQDGCRCREPSLTSNEKPSSSRSDSRGSVQTPGAVRAGLGHIAQLAAPSGLARRTMAAPHASRYVSRARLMSSGSRRLGRLEELDGRLGDRAGRQCDLPAQQIDPGALQFGLRIDLRGRQQSKRFVERSGMELGLGSGQRPLGSSPPDPWSARPTAGESAGGGQPAA